MFIATTTVKSDSMATAEILCLEEFDTMEAAVEWAADSLEEMAIDANTEYDEEGYCSLDENPAFMAAAALFRNGSTLRASVQAPGEPETYTVTISADAN
jgi:hypothetical protein